MFKWLSFILLIPLIGIVACRSPQQTASPRKTTSFSQKYTTAFPTRDVAQLLNRAQQSTVRIISTSYYATYLFDKPSTRLESIRSNKLENIASQKKTSEESTAGTSIILDLKPDGQSLLITCAHAVTSPDTLISYFPEEVAPPNTFVQSISIKKRQNNFIFDTNNFSTFEVIAQNTLADLALITAQFKTVTDQSHNSIPFPMGRSENIQTGSFLYVFGFPKGFPMITRGLANTQGLEGRPFFITDALFNPGISGGLIIASNDRFNSFEWVGMARSATADREKILIPDPAIDNYEERIGTPYTDDIFIGRKNRISYGITQAIPIREIRSFLSENKDIIRNNGF